jgi:ABC-2 type transport system ATP-binding protein
LTASARTRRVGDALELVGLAGDAGRKVGTFSTGVRQRLGLAAALLRAPRLLLLDEPTAGLEPEGTREMRTLLRELAQDGVSVLFSSHEMAEVEQSARPSRSCGPDRWCRTGRSRRFGPRPVPEHRLVTSNDVRPRRSHARFPGLPLEADPDRCLRVSADTERLDEFVLALGQAGMAVREFELAESPLETMFFRLTGAS